MSNYRNIVVLTGAGISKESGLSTFRDADGEWSKVAIEDVCTPEALERDPGRVNAFYNARRKQLQTVEPNEAHVALARLEQHYKGNITIVTQNIDDLHKRAGSQNIIHIHGELLKVVCQQCGKHSVWEDDVLPESQCLHCGESGVLRPHVVFFGEMPLQMTRVYELLNECDLFVSIGTSGNVYPAAGFVEIALGVGAHTLELNLEPSEGASLFAEQRYGPATQMVPDFCAELL